jgi:hypothetical protein
MLYSTKNLSSLLILFAIVATGIIVLYQKNNKAFDNSTSSVFSSNIAQASIPIIIPSSGCAVQPKINLESTANSQLKQLSKYQEICNSQVASKVMLFTQIPSTIDAIESKVADLSSQSLLMERKN